MNLLTNSRMRSFRTCARLHQFQYVEGYRPIVAAEALRFGSLMHAGLEAWWGQAAKPESDPLAEAIFAVRDNESDPWDLVRAEELLTGYHARWIGHAPLYDVLAVEAGFRAPMWNPDTDRDSRTWELAGKIDAIARVRDSGSVCVVEHKTTVEAIEDDSDHYWSTLALDLQISGYVIGAESLGHTVDEILYDVIRKPQQRPLLATPVESRKFTKDGRLYATQREFDETLDEYRARLRAAIEAEPQRFFQRRMIPRTQSQVRDYLAAVWAQGKSMHDMATAGVSFPNPEACHRFGTCSFWSACSSGTHPSDHPTKYVKVENVNPELGETA